MFKDLIITLTLIFFGTVANAVEYVPGEVIVRLKKSANVSAYAGVSNIYGSEFKVMKVDKSRNVFEVITELASDPNVEYAEPNYIYHISNTPNDTHFTKLWGMNNTGQTIQGVVGDLWPTHNPGTSGSDIDAVSAWSLLNDCSSVVVAVIDTGVKYDHPDLLANMWNGGSTYPKHGYDFVNTDNDPMDDCGHGTHVAGIIGAVGNNSIGVTGVCWQTNLMALKAFAADGQATAAAIISAIGFAIDNGAHIINASFNIYTYSSALSAAITESQAAGILFVAAAGNGYLDDGNRYNVDTGTKTYPCCFTQDSVMCVAALDQSFELASFSNYGSTSVDVAAPGTNIYSTWCSSAGTCSSAACGVHNADYVLKNGTSMATPYAAGLAALVWANNPNFTYIDVKNAVMYGGSSVDSMSGVSVSGNVINVSNALAYINVPTGLTATVQ